MDRHPVGSDGITGTRSSSTRIKMGGKYWSEKLGWEEQDALADEFPSKEAAEQFLGDHRPRLES